MLLAPALPAMADPFGEAVARLGSDDFAEKEQAILALGKLGDPRAAPVLSALGDGRLLKAPDGRVVIADTAGGPARVLDAATGAPIPDLSPDKLDRIRVNNRLRNAIEGVFGSLTLFS